MTFEERSELIGLEIGAQTAARDAPFILVELIKVLAPHPGGLRRWSVMRAIRKDREMAAREIPQKFEDDVERTFRRFCGDAKDGKIGTSAPKDAFFYRPKEKAGEVWCIYPARAKAWLDAEPFEIDLG